VTIATNMAGRGTDILLGGNPEFLARSDMENEWISRASNLPLQGVKRYEDGLRDLKDKYEEEVRRAEERYRNEGEIYQEKRAAALKKTTELQKTLWELSPFRRTHNDYEQVSTTEWIDALHDLRSIPDRYLKVKDQLERSVLKTGDAADPNALHAFEDASANFTSLISRWQQGDGNRRDLMEALDETRRNYEQRLADYEFAVTKALLVKGEHAATVSEYDEARHDFEEAENRCEEIRVPFEEAVRQAQRNYETKRQEFVRAVEEIREQLEKAPDTYRQRYDEILAGYQKICAEEREKVIAAGGLHIIGTERHESRRIDNQLRGRSGRQGDPGSSRFYLSLEDDLMRIFGADRIQGIMTRLGMEEGVPIEHGLVTRAIENAQKKVEAHNFDMRKHLLEYDDVMNKQREVIYHRRREILKGENLRAEVLEMAERLAEEKLDTATDKNLPPDEWDLTSLNEALHHQFNVRLQIKPEDREKLTPERLQEIVVEQVTQAYGDKEGRFGESLLRQLERFVMLQTIDNLWKDHLLNMDHLKEGVSLRGYGQKNPLQEYQREAFDTFEEMMQRIEEDCVQKLFTVELAEERPPQEFEVQQHRQRMVLSHGQDEAEQNRAAPVRRQASKVGRNDPCPCGSGKKYKRCCGK
jgi:preprotein translocase subunit SecA